jgi:hypothetical protein
MNFLIIIAVGVSVVLLDDSQKDLSAIIEDELICKHFISTVCDKKEKDV